MDLRSSIPGQGIEPFYFGTYNQPLFGCYYAPQSGSNRDCGVVLCHPMGEEYIRFHRAFRQLTARLSNAGFPVLRFDFYGCGDSAGDCAQGRLRQWCTDVSTAIGEMRRRSSVAHVCLVGLRLGGTLAMLVGAKQKDIDSMVLWDPVVNGRAYVEELMTWHQTMLRYAHVQPKCHMPGEKSMEILGFPLTDAMLADLKNIDLLAIQQKPANHILVMESHREAGQGRLREHLQRLAAQVEYQCLPVPHLWSWLEDSEQDSGAAPALAGHSVLDCRGVSMRETAVLLSPMRSLVGVMSYPPETVGCRHLPAVILLNAGLIHRVGPNRLYVKMARMLAAMGFVVLRFDFSGIGDSGVRADTLPFAESAIRETQEAMDYLHAVRGSERFVLMGVCSGANASFRTACGDPRVVGVVLINAWGHLHTTSEALNASLRHRVLARHYWRIAFSSPFRAKNWAKAMTGHVDYQGLVKAILSLPRRSLFAPQNHASSETQRAAAVVRSLLERDVRLLHVYSEGDKGLDYFRIMLGDEGRHVRCASDKMKLEIVYGVDHTFTLLWSQERLLQIIRQWAQATWHPAGH